MKTENNFIQFEIKLFYSIFKIVYCIESDKFIWKHSSIADINKDQNDDLHNIIRNSNEFKKAIRKHKINLWKKQ